MRVLIIEDDGDLREALEGLFDFSDFLCEVQAAEHGRLALSYLHSLPPEEIPDFIILDIGMPVMNGFEFRAAQLADERLCGIPVVVITGSHWTQEDVDRLRPDYYLSKPFRPADLDKIIRSIALSHKTHKMSTLTSVEKRRL